MNLSGVLLAGGKSSRLRINKLQVCVGKVPLFIDQIFKLSFFCSEILVSTSKQNLTLIEGEFKDIKGYLKNFSEISGIKSICGLDPGERSGAFLDKPEIKIVLDDLDDIGTDKIHRETGPIAGIYSGLKEITNHYALVLAFDMPFVSFRMIKTLTDILEQDTVSAGKKSSTVIPGRGNDAFIIKTEKGFEVLSGIYSKGCLKALETGILKGDNKISNIFKNIRTGIIEKEILESRDLDMLNFFNINRDEDYYRFKDIWKNKSLKCEHAAGYGNAFFKRWAGFFFR